ncbi:hypothetical protein PCAR4_40216 [Paraburkholderia caribensis]|nr:hypothetical protein PCAR4_40216 [Paraburkholderia caribensis]
MADMNSQRQRFEQILRQVVASDYIDDVLSMEGDGYAEYGTVLAWDLFQMTEKLSTEKVDNPVDGAAPLDPHKLLEIARETGLRSFLHGVNATDARTILERYQSAVDDHRASLRTSAALESGGDPVGDSTKRSPAPDKSEAENPGGTREPNSPVRPSLDGQIGPGKQDHGAMAKDADMVWLKDDTEAFAHSIDEAVDDYIANYGPLPAGRDGEFELERAMRLPNVKIRVWRTPGEEDDDPGYGWEIVDAAIAASAEQGDKA